MLNLPRFYSWTKDGKVISGQVSEDLMISQVDQPDNSANSIYECTATPFDTKFEGNKLNGLLI